MTASSTPRPSRRFRRFKETGRRLILVTGRELPTSSGCFREIELFDRVVAENGALLYDPREPRRRRVIAPAPPPTVRRAGCEAQECRAAVGRPLDRRDLGAARDGRARGDPRARPRAADHLQQGRGDGPAGRRQQGDRPCGGARASCGCRRTTSSASAMPRTITRSCAPAAVRRRSPTRCRWSRTRPIVRLAGDRGAGVVELIETDHRDKDAQHRAAGRHGILVGTDREGEDVYHRALSRQRADRRQLGHRQVDPGDGADRAHGGTKVRVLRVRSGGRLCRARECGARSATPRRRRASSEVDEAPAPRASTSSSTRRRLSVDRAAGVLRQAAARISPSRRAEDRPAALAADRRGASSAAGRARRRRGVPAEGNSGRRSSSPCIPKRFRPMR